ncbi:Predicted dithiol-disulfide isomerase, DsbA family [Pseudonocardia oroxyli]|uniref:Predicted dithiol-disulfide isomerase, DsbA family n=1 Tax=Pseudonocardia oroxyli TaxID=366584 RepID=A0A1G7YPC3_PSEOR|nr:Predicted dithiol-disulfide isomerase, DsbA family [Pseudonocardia oroxyli]
MGIAVPGGRLSPSVKLEIWSDVACPWCALGTRRIAAALAAFPHEVEVRYRSFELDPHAPRAYEGDRTQRLSAKIGADVPQVRAMEQRLADLAAADGLEIRFDRTQDGNTFDAHRLLHLAWDLGGAELQSQVKSALVTALFRDGEPIGSVEALRRVAVAAGLPEADVDRVLGSAEYTDAVRADEETARSLGISGVPFYVLDRRYGVSGAQSVEVLVQALEQAWSESDQESDQASGEGSAQAGTSSGNAR